MTEFNKLTYLSKVYHFRKLAENALDTFGLSNARFKLIRIAGNGIFRVFTSNPVSFRTTEDLFEPGQYILRIHDKSEQETDALELEMEWPTAIRRDAGLPVPELVSTPEGKLLIQVSIPGFPEKRDCTLLRWMKGGYVKKGI